MLCVCRMIYMYVYVRRYDKHLTGKLKLSEFKLFHRDLWEQKHLDFEYSYDMCVEMFGESDFHVHYCKVAAFFRQVQCSTVQCCECSTVWTEAECAVHMCVCVSLFCAYIHDIHVYRTTRCCSTRRRSAPTPSRSSTPSSTGSAGASSVRVSPGLWIV